jgi:UDP-4-amino-4,6-dideoxy-N-acetyl-beta-L-altrosamine N-acetyltransferase
MLTQQEIALNEHQQWFERNSQDFTRRLLIVEEGGMMLGFVQFKDVAPGATSNWGFYAAHPVRKGAGKKLGSTALRFAFQVLNLHKVCGQALDINEASIRLHRQLDFHQEGVLRQQHQIDGFYHDLVCFGLLQDEWRLKNRKEQDE